ncbi:MAG: orotidine-5'-phosphate decarboxylase [Bacteriovoracaceae bacterium]|jgi:orotidine-5'-phosphate decarboxylase|nr:orotidine-5'-phosphate decarboxylase [Bacteriovoracaceae bacterium]
MEVILALDFNDFKQSKKIIDELIDTTKWFKVGMESFYSHGHELLEYLNKKDAKVFLDLKYYDIPTTVEKAIKALVQRYNIHILNVHASGGKKMLEASKNIINTYSKDTKLIGVTTLTSFDEKSFSQVYSNSIIDTNKSLTRLCVSENLDGIVCSSNDIKHIKNIASDDFLYITPGIRLNSNNNDQIRVTTPKMAKQNGSTHIVVGREVTQSNNPKESLLKIRQNIYDY